MDWSFCYKMNVSYLLKNKIEYIKKTPFIIASLVFYIFHFCGWIKGDTIIEKFNREIGKAAVLNFDISILLKNIYFIYLVIFPILVFAISVIVVAFCNFGVKRKGECYLDIVCYANDLSFFFLIPILSEYIQKFNTKIPFAKVCDIVVVVLVCILIYPFIRDNKEANIKDLNWMLVVGFNMSFIICFVIKTYIVSLVFSFVFLCLLLNKITDSEKFKNAYSILSLFLCVSAIILESLIVMNQHNLIICKPVLVISIVFVLICVICWIIYKSKCRVKKSYSLLEWGILLGAICYAGLPKVQMVVSTDLFEQANIALPFEQLVQFQKIPFVETISAHMASDWIPNLVYYLFNGDLFGALFSPYALFFNIVWILMLYVVLRQIMQSQAALLVCLFFPFNSYNAMWGSLCIVSLCSLGILFCNDSWKNLFLFWGALLGGVLYKADVGMAIGVGVIFSYVIVNLLRKKKIRWFRFLFSGIIIGSVALGIFSYLCLQNGISVLQRIKEFVAILAGSNEIWSHGELGLSGNLQYSIIYFFLPVIVIGLIILYCALIRKEKTDNQYLDAVTLSLGIAYLVNLQRIVVRHNIMEGGYSINLTFTAGFFISLVCYSLVKESKDKIFVFAMLIFSVILSIDKSSMTNDYYGDEISLYNHSLAAMCIQKIDDGNIVKAYSFSEKILRVDTGTDMKKQYEEVVDEINRLLKQDETFFDFSNQSLIYALAQRKLPVYVVQSPGLLSGEFSQECFIQQLMTSNCPIAISSVDDALNCSVGIDGVQNAYRQYKVSEYLNNNYKPIEVVGGFVIWVKNDRDDISRMIENSFLVYEWESNLPETDDCTIEYVQEEIRIKSLGDNPCVYNIKIPVGEKGTYTVTIPYKSNLNGQVQLYYANNIDNGYSEKKLLVQEIEYEGVMTFTLDASQAKYLKLVFPESIEITMKNAFYSEGSRSLGGYNYGDSKNIHEYNIGAIPYLWGTVDEKEAYKGLEVLNCKKENGGYKVNYNDLKKYDSLYIKIVVYSPQDTMGCVSVGRYYNNDYIDQIKYNLNFYQGMQTYLIRITADSNWRKGKVGSIVIEPDLGQVTSVSIIRGE